MGRAWSKGHTPGLTWVMSCVVSASCGSNVISWRWQGFWRTLRGPGEPQSPKIKCRFLIPSDGVCRRVCSAGVSGIRPGLRWPSDTHRCQRCLGESLDAEKGIKLGDNMNVRCKTQSSPQQASVAFVCNQAKRVGSCINHWITNHWNTVLLLKIDLVLN